MLRSTAAMRGSSQFLQYLRMSSSDSSRCATGSTDERFGKSLRGQFVGAERGQFGPLAPLGLAFVLRNGGSALRLPELRERLVEVLGRVEVMLKQKLDGAFPRLTAFAHATSIAEKRAR